MHRFSPMAKLVLMDEHTFVVSDELGDLGEGDPADGLYHNDTRYLSYLRLTLNGTPLSLLAAPPAESTTATVHLTNQLFTLDDAVPVLPQTISLRRTRTLEGELRDEFELVNYNRFPIPFRLEVLVAADFRDMFDIRGIAQAPVGDIEPPEVRHDEIVFRSRGRDAVDRELYIRVDPPFTTHRRSHRTEYGVPEPISLPDAGPGAAGQERTVYRVHGVLSGVLEPQQPFHAVLTAEPREREPAVDLLPFAPAGSNRHRKSEHPWPATRITTSSDALNRLLQRGQADLAMLTWHPPTGTVPVAGIPWFACPFGRDSVIAALESLMLAPDLAVGTLRFLAAHQGQRRDDWRDEEPGKMMHELRFGELARLGAIPHSPYYGSVDVTPLYLILLGETTRWLGDDALLDELWPNAEAALAWIEQYGDLDGDGFVEYLCRCPVGIRNQGWKDSADSVTHADGTLAEPPIALIEVQGYAYAARVAMAELYRRRGQPQRADELERAARSLRRRVHERFWLDDLSCYAEALDRDKRPVAVVTSNAAHTLFCGLPEPENARALCGRLTRPDMLVGWGLRTLSSDAPSYNPMSYHNGSIWPHDNAIAMAGLARYAFPDVAVQLFDELFTAAQGFRGFRLPELYCGFARGPGAGRAPAAYPVSCSPQAWAAGAPFLMLQALLGLEPRAGGRLRLAPSLPPWLDWLQLDDLRVGSRRASLRVAKRGDRWDVDVTAGEVEVEVQTGAACGSLR
jgi:glycogen debranching enzyme